MDNEGSSSTHSSLASFTINETESTIYDYDPNNIKKAIAVYDRTLEREREYRERKKAEMTQEQTEEQLRKRREYARRYREKKDMKKTAAN